MMASNNKLSTRPSLPKLCLASESPRRRQLLESLGLSFAVVKPKAVELMPTAQDADRVVLINARRKWESVLPDVDREAIIVSADTLVILNDRVLGQPRDPTDAKAMLQELSGRIHIVTTGLAFFSHQYGEHSVVTKSRVSFRHLSKEEIENYTKTREPYDKAGAYAVQGLGAIFIKNIEGSYSNVMGLPIENFLLGLEKISNISLYQWFS